MSKRVTGSFLKLEKGTWTPIFIKGPILFSTLASAFTLALTFASSSSNWFSRLVSHEASQYQIVGVDFVVHVGYTSRRESLSKRYRIAVKLLKELPDIFYVFGDLPLSLLSVAHPHFRRVFRI